MRLINLDQQSSDWLEWRMGGIGGSDAAIVMGVNKRYDDKTLTRETLLRQKIIRRFGAVRKTDIGKSPAMMRGIEKEPLIRDEYNRRTGRNLQPACGIHSELDWMRASFDGLAEDGLLVLEIKAPCKDDHERALEGFVPTHYWPQVQHLLAVSAAPKLHYLSWSENRFFGDQHFAKVIVNPDRVYIERLIDQESRFVEEINRGREKMKNPKKRP